MAVSASDVKLLLGSTQLSDSDIDKFITRADNYYSDLTSDASVGSTMKDQVVENLAAHEIKQGPERQTASNDVAGATYTNEYGQGLEATTFGQTALAKDPTGELKAEDGADHFTLGTP